MLAERFDHPKVRFWAGVLIGAPATFFAVPLAFVGLVTGWAVIGGSGRPEGFAMVLGSVLGPAGIVGAWLRLACSEAMLRESPTRRRLVLMLLAAGVLASLTLSALFWVFPDTRLVSVMFVFTAVLGAFLMWVTRPVRPNSTLYRTRA
jgi:hypothetical protein